MIAASALLVIPTGLVLGTAGAPAAPVASWAGEIVPEQDSCGYAARSGSSAGSAQLPVARQRCAAALTSLWLGTGTAAGRTRDDRVLGPVKFLVNDHGALSYVSGMPAPSPGQRPAVADAITIDPWALERIAADQRVHVRPESDHLAAALGVTLHEAGHHLVEAAHNRDRGLPRVNGTLDGERVADCIAGAALARLRAQDLIDDAMVTAFAQMLASLLADENHLEGTDRMADLRHGLAGPPSSCAALAPPAARAALAAALGD